MADGQWTVDPNHKDLVRDTISDGLMMGIDPGLGDRAAFPAALRTRPPVTLVPVGAVGATGPAFSPWRGMTGPPGPSGGFAIDGPLGVIPVGIQQGAHSIVIERLVMERDQARKNETAAIAAMNEWKTTAELGAQANQDLRERVREPKWFVELAGKQADCISTLEAEIADLRKRLWLPVEPGDHNYHGPTETVPHPTIDGKTVQRPLPDPVHERFHGAVGDVLAGRVIPEARRQMQEALKAAPKEPTAIPMAGSKDDPRRMGCEWLARL